VRATCSGLFCKRLLHSKALLGNSGKGYVHGLMVPAASSQGPGSFKTAQLGRGSTVESVQGKGFQVQNGARKGVGTLERSRVESRRTTSEGLSRCSVG